MPKKLVGVAGGFQDPRNRVLFDALAELYPVEFRGVESPNNQGLDAVVVLDGDAAKGLAAGAEGLPSLVVAPREAASKAVAPGEVCLGTSPLLDACLHNQAMVDLESPPPSPLLVQPGDEIIASMDGKPVWLNRRTGTGACQIAGLPLPPMCEKEFLFQCFNGRRFMQLLPLMNFLRQLVKDTDWQTLASPACFVFDDPSLYRPSYGHLNFRRLAEEATKHNFFVSVATIPLDTWWVNRGVAETFRSFSPRLSILIHGNNHTTREMLLQTSGAGHLAVAAQAMRRMERLERRHGIKFLRVMEAPHGALANDLFQHLLVLGYEAALCTAELLVRHNPDATWPATFGMHRSEILGGGLPVIPRIKMSPNWKNDVLLKVFLRQPVIIAGHHYNAANGMEFMTELANMVNGLGTVTWSDIQDVLRTNYLQRIEGDALTVKLCSRRVLITIPQGIRRLRVERPWIPQGGTEKLIIGPSGAAAVELEAGSETEWIIPGIAAAVEAASRVANPLHSSKVPPPSPSPWPIARKMLMEIRDRLSPALPFLASHPQSIHRTPQ